MLTVPATVRIFLATSPTDMPIEPKEPAGVYELGFFHPDGQRYVSSMFTYAVIRYVFGAAKKTEGSFRWLCYDLPNFTSSAVPLALNYTDGRPVNAHLLYGSITRDNHGAFYIAGTDQRNNQPVLLKLTPIEQRLAPHSSLLPAPSSSTCGTTSFAPNRS